MTFHSILFCFTLFWRPVNHRVIDTATGVHECRVRSCRERRDPYGARMEERCVQDFILMSEKNVYRLDLQD